MYIVSYYLCSDRVDGCDGWVRWDHSRATCDCENTLQGANWHQQDASCKCALSDSILSMIACILFVVCTLWVTSSSKQLFPREYVKKCPFVLLPTTAYDTTLLLPQSSHTQSQYHFIFLYLPHHDAITMMNAAARARTLEHNG